MLERIATAWCQRMHTDVTWPIHGHYHCLVCRREYQVEWEGLPKVTEYADPALYNAGAPAPVSLAQQV